MSDDRHVEIPDVDGCFNSVDDLPLEEEALVCTWACECLADYLVRLKFHIQTDHKRLVSSVQNQTP